MVQSGGHMSERRTAIYMGAVILITQIAWVLFAYWARVQTFIVERGRFRAYEPLLRSDFAVFVAPFVASILVTAIFLPRRARIGPATTSVLAIVLAVAGELIALLIAFNLWGV
jgi:hypothetical protein